MASSDETDRRAVLRRYAVLDALPDAPFDRITRLAARWFDAPIALITLVGEDRQGVKSCYGLDEHLTDREIAFCTYTVRDDDVMVVEDATEDARFADNPLVTGEPGIRFYAGAPLITPDGYRIGSLCVIDTTPRRIDDPDVLAPLKDLAQIAADEIELHVAHPHQADILESITDAFFAVDSDWRFTYINGQAERLLRRSRDELLGKNVWEEFPEAVDLAFYEQYHRAMRTGERVQFEAYFPPLETWFHVNAYPFEDGLSVYFDDVTDRKQTEAALREREEYLSVTLNSIGDAVIATDPDGRVSEMNDVAEQLTGWPREEAQGRLLTDIFLIHNAKTGAPVENPVEKVLRKGMTVGLANHTVLTARDGTERQIADSAAPIRTAAGDLLGVVLAFRDVTEHYERREALNEERQRLELALIGGDLGLWDLDINEGQNVVNERWAEMLGYTLDEVGDSQSFFEEHVHPDDLERAYEALKRHARGEIPYIDVEIRMRHKDGSWRWILDRGKVLEWNEDGSPRRAVGTHLDITDRKRREEALRESKIALEQAQALAQIGNGIWDLERGVFTLSDEGARLLGLDAETEYPIDTLINLAHPDDRAQLAAELDGLRAGETHDTEYRIVLDDAEAVRWLRGRARPETDEDGTVTRVFGTITDITERKKREQELRRQRDLLSQTQRLAGAWEYDLERGTVSWSDEVARILEWPPGKPIRFEDMGDLFTAEGRPQLQAAIQAAIEEREPYDLELPLITMEGNERWVRTVGAPVEGDGEVVKLAGALQDVTERRQMEERLRAQEQMYRELVQTTSAILWRGDPETFAFTYVSPQAEALLGYAPEAWTTDPDFWVEHIHPDDRAWAPAYCQQATEEKRRHSFDYRMVAADGETVWLRDIVNVRIEDGEAKELIGVMIDITELKQAEQALRESEERWRTLVESHPEPIHITVDGHYAYINPSGARLFGVDDPDEMIGRSVFDFVNEDTKEHIQARKEQLDRGEATEPFEHRMVRLDGEERIVVARSVPIIYKGQPAAQTVIRDVTEQRRAKQALRESEERYRTLVERSHDAIYIYRGDRLLFVNRRVCELTGYAEEELLNMNVFTLVHPDDRERVRRYASQRMEGDAPERYEARLVRADGGVRYGEFSVQAITYQGTFAAIGSIRDVTQRREVEEALRESEQRFRDVVRAAGEYVWEIDADDRYTYVTEQVQAVKGHAPRALIGHTPYEFMPEADAAEARRIVAEAKADGDEFTLEHRDVTAEGDVVWERVNGTPIFGEDDAVIGFRGTGLSVTEQKEARRALERREAKVQALYEAMRALMLAPTREQVAERIQTLIVDTLRYPISAVRYLTTEGTLQPAAISAKTKELMPDRPDYARDGESLVAQAFRGGDTAIYGDVYAEDPLHDRGAVRAAAYVPIGSYGIISIGSPDKEGIDRFDVKLIEILARNAEGVLERIEREDALREARDEAEEMNRLKSAFLANMSHEIRTPLTSIIGFAEVLAEQDLGQASRFTELIRSGGQRLLETLNSVLDLSQLEAGSMRLAPKTIDVTHTVQAAVDLFTPKAQKKNIAFQTDVPDEPVEATLDEAALHRVLTNLLSNAVKFTGEGGRVDVRVDPQPVHLVLEVEDTGVGIDEDFVDHLFDAFQQESSGDARAFEGSGLGLTITHRLVGLMGGDIAVATEKGEGTRFTVRLPYRIAAAGDEGAAP